MATMAPRSVSLVEGLAQPPAARLRRARSSGRAGVLALLALLAPACRPHRTLMIESVPAGAVVRLDERPIGRTPLSYPFDHYGVRRISLYAPGYLTHSQRIDLSAPWFARFPIDLFTEVLLPLGLHHRVKLPVVHLEPDDGIEAQPAATEFVQRAARVRAARPAEAENARSELPGAAASPAGPGAAAPSTGPGAAAPSTGPGATAPSTGPGATAPSTGPGAAAPSTGPGATAPPAELEAPPTPTGGAPR